MYIYIYTHEKSNIFFLLFASVSSDSSPFIHSDASRHDSWPCAAAHRIVAVAVAISSKRLVYASRLTVSFVVHMF